VPVNVTLPSSALDRSVGWNHAVQHERLQNVAAEVRVGAPVLLRIRTRARGDTCDAGEMLDVVLRLALLPEAGDRPAQADDTVIGRDRDPELSDLRIPEELVG